MAELDSLQSRANRRWLLLGAVLLVLGALFYALQPILAPFVLGALIAYLGDPLMDALERRGIGRTLGAVVVFALLGLIIVVTLLITVPLLAQQLDVLIRKIPGLYHWFADVAMPWVQTRLNLPPDRLPPLDVGSKLAENWQTVGKFIADTGRELTGSGASLLASIGGLVLVPVVAFYLLRDWDELMARILALVPQPWQPRLQALARESDEVVGAFLRGQFIVMCALAGIYASGLWLVGLDLAFLLGMIAGLASIVPYLGMVVGVGAASIAAVIQFQDLFVLVWVALVFGAGQVIESMVLTPILVGDRIGLHPVAVIFAILAGGQLAGFVGVLVALPVAAVIMVFLRHIHDYYTESDLYGPRGTGTEPGDD